MIHFSYQAPEKADRIDETMKTEFNSCHWSTTRSFSVTHCLIYLQFALLGENRRNIVANFRKYLCSTIQKHNKILFGKLLIYVCIYIYIYIYIYI